MMTNGSGRDPAADQAFLDDLDDEQASLAGDIVQLDAQLWAVHGVIPVDGDVLLAEFGTYEQARDALDEALRHQERPVLPESGLGTSTEAISAPGTRRCSLTDSSSESEPS